MSRVSSKDSWHAAPTRLRSLLLAASVLTLCACDLAVAQSLDGLRGEVTESETNDQLLDPLLPRRRRTEDDVGRRPTTPGEQAANRDATAPGAPGVTPTYDPISAGGLTEAEERERRATSGVPSIFDDAESPDDAADPFSDAAPVPSPRPRARPAAGTAGNDGESTNERATAAERRSREGPETAEQRNRPDDAASDDDDLTTGTTRSGTIDSELEDELALDRGAERERAIEGLDIEREDNPYEAVGIRFGSFILRPSVEQGLTATNNANNSAGGSDAILSETTLRLNAVSDWSQHNAAFNAFGNFRKSVSGQELEETRGGIDGLLDYELSSDYRLKSSLNYTFEPESASSPDALVGVSSQPTQHNLEGSLGLSKDVGLLRFGVTGKIDREWYGDAELTDGTTLSLEDRNSTLASVALRTGYEVTPALRPFVEIEAGRRFRDVEVDADGYERTSNVLSARAGIELDRGEKLTGEISAGVLRETFDDDRLDPITGPSLNANLRWSPERGTIVGLTGTTTVDSSTDADDSGSLFYATRLTVEREIRANLTANAMLGIDLRDYSGTDDTDTTFLAEAGATWWLNRYAGLTGRLRYETLKSDLPNRDYESSSAFLGLKVQR